MSCYRLLSLCLMLFFSLADPSRAHYGIILLDKSMVMQGDNLNLELTVAFLHPFEPKGMPMAKAKSFRRLCPTNLELKYCKPAKPYLASLATLDFSKRL